MPLPPLLSYFSISVFFIAAADAYATDCRHCRLPPPSPCCLTSTDIAAAR
jgi:hypothetical protein